MNLLAPVSTIMTTDLRTVSPNDTLKNVEDLFRNNRFHHLPVVIDNELIGMVSKSDYFFFKRGFNDNSLDAKVDLFRLKTHKVKDIMITKLAKLEVSDKINVALEVFKENLFHALPVVEGNKLVGMVTTFDIINHLAKDQMATKSYV